MKKIGSFITPPQTATSIPILYTDLTRGAGLFGIGANVQLENRVLADYLEIDPALGHNTVGAILSVLGCQVIAGGALGDSRITVCLARRESGHIVEVDLAVFRRLHRGLECYFVRFVDERELGSNDH